MSKPKLVKSELSDKEKDAFRLEFLQTLVPTGYVELRALRGEQAATKIFSIKDVTKIDKFIQQHLHSRNLYFGVAERVDPLGDGSKKNCGNLWALFGEWDKPYEDVNLGDCPEPSILIDSGGGGTHGYTLLEAAIPHDGEDEIIEQTEMLITKHAEVVSYEDQSRDLSRVLRIPYTYNFKYVDDVDPPDPPRKVTVRKFEPTQRWNIEYLEFALKDVVVSSKAKHSKPLPSAIQDHTRNDTLFRHGCLLRRYGYGQEEIQGVLEILNHQRCNPPLPTAEVARIAKSCCRYEPMEDTYRATETGDAEYFVTCNEDHVYFDHLRKRWLVFDDVRWKPQRAGEITQLAIQAMRGRYRAAIDGPADRRRWAAAGESRKRIINMLTLAHDLPGIADDGLNWDRNQWLLGVPNGVVDLKTGKLRPGRQEDRITMQTRMPFDPDAKCPVWDKTVKEIFNNNEELIDFFQRFVGYSLTGDCSEEVMAFCWGTGRNGKGTTMNTIAWMLGDYAGNLPFSTLELHDRSIIPNDLAKIDGKRFVTASESSEISRFNTARIKLLTGRDPVDARFMHKDWFTYIVTYKLWVAANKKPVAKDSSIAFWERLELIPFTQSFAENPNKQLKDILMTEGMGILAWAVRGCKEWQKHKLSPPSDVKEATEQYRLDSLPLTEFIDECCVLVDGIKTKFNLLLTEYRSWCSKTRQKVWLNRTDFQNALADLFESEELPRKQGTVYIGIALLAKEEEEEEEKDERF